MIEELYFYRDCFEKNNQLMNFIEIIILILLYYFQ